MRTQLTRTGKRLVVLAGLLCATLGGTGLNSTDSATAPAEDWIEAQISARDELKDALVMDIVREYRPTAAAGWHRTLANAIIEESRAEELDPLLAVAIIAKESSFRSQVVSHAGAIGLMQLRPWVAEDLALRTDVEWDGEQTLRIPNLNVRLGLRYYTELLDRFGDEHVALTAYCFGPSRVSRQIRTGTYQGSRYARDILDHYERLNERSAV